ncbi:MOSC N-terminal beta barrel domain-containing protein, partial [Rhodosalinus sediminis]
MTARLTEIWRHPIKAHGREALDRVRLEAGATLPWDRAWAVAHEAARTDGSAWAPCAEFTRGAKAPALMAIEAALDEATETVTLRHPDRPALTFRPDT